MFDLLGRKITPVLLFIFLFTTSSSAQIKGNFNFLDFANKPYYFGITLAYNTSNYRIVHATDFIKHDSISIAESTFGSGFNLGIVTNLKIGQHFDVRFLPTLSFTDRNFQYRLTSTEVVDRRIESVYVEMPFHVRYKSAPFQDIRLFVIGGIKYSFDVASNSRTRQAEELVQIAPSDFAVEYGAGAQFFFPYFIFSPEIKVSHGLSNTLIFNDNLGFSTVLEKVLSQTFTISFHFEG